MEKKHNERSVVRERLVEDELIAGAIDLHAHGYPEVSLYYKGRLTDRQWAETVQQMKMGGFVIKSHIWPTMERAYALQTQFPDLKIYGSIALNPHVRGLSPWAVESAIQLGAKVLWFPTWGARFDIEHHGGKYFRSHLPFAAALSPEQGISLLDDAGAIRSEVKEIMRLAKDADLMVGTGHISPAESVKLAAYCKDIEFKKLILTHPLSLGASKPEIEQMADLGCYIELTCLHVLVQTVKVSDVIEVIRNVGYQRCLLTTDAFFTWTPPEPEMLRMFIGILYYHGLEYDAIRHMVHTNPRKLLGLSEEERSVA